MNINEHEQKINATDRGANLSFQRICGALLRSALQTTDI